MLVQPIEEEIHKNETVCALVSYTLAAGSYYLPESEFAKRAGLVLGISSTFACAVEG